MHQVHDQESDIIGRIDPAQFMIELDGIKRHEPAVLHQQVFKVQIAMAFPDEAVPRARLENRFQRRRLLQGPGLDHRQLL